MRLTTGAICVCLASISSLGWAQTSSPPPKPALADSSAVDALDDLIGAEMRKRHISGLSLAIIEDGKIMKAKGYGVTEQAGTAPVTTSTLFQAGSISKPVSALGALLLVQEGKLELDKDVNARLVTWKVPENEFTRERKVTLRGLLSHTAGLTVHGFPGYATDEPHPTSSRSWTARSLRIRRRSAWMLRRAARGAIPAAATPSCSNSSST
jgi:CubicO group peptidase (beta-lactamase class C family)